MYVILPRQQQQIKFSWDEFYSNQSPITNTKLLAKEFLKILIFDIDSAMFRSRVIGSAHRVTDERTEKIHEPTYPIPQTHHS